MKSKFFLSLGLLVVLLSIASRLSAQTGQSNRQLTQAPTSPQTHSSQRRVALVIGNGIYQHAGRLANPPNDATLVAATLRQLGFEVKNGSNLSQREMKQRIREFGQTLRANGGVGLFYFAGHGVQAKGHNYLVPVDADIQTEADLEDVAVDLNYVLSLMDDAQNALNIVVLDACRNNPFARSFRSSQEGLAQVKAPTGTLIAYATAPDSIAADGTGSNSPYTQELIKQMRASGVLVETMFRRVTEQVSARTNGKQEPWFSANVKGDFYFTGAPTNSTMTNSTSANNTAPTTTANSVAAEYVKSGDQLALEKKWNEAEVEYRLAVRLDPGNAEWHNKLGLALFSGGKYSEAEAEYRVAIRLEPNIAASHYSLAQTLNEGEKKYPEAESEVREAIRLDENNSTYRNYLVWVLNEQLRYSESEAEANELVRRDPKNSWAYAALGYALAAGNKVAAAETAFREAIKLNANIGPWHGGLASALFRQQKFAEAEAEVKEGLRLDRNSADSHHVLASLFNEWKKSYSEAEKEEREAIRLAPDTIGYRGYLAWILQEEQRYSDAESEAKEALRRDPKNPWLYDGLGWWALLPQNKNSEAETAFREAIRLESEVGTSSSFKAQSHRGLAWALQRQKKFAEAEAEYQESLRLDPKDYTRAELDNLHKEIAASIAPPEPGKLGLFVENKNYQLVVSSVIPNTPGARAGVKVGDQITKINGQAVTDPSGAAALLQGNAGTSVTLTVLTPGTSARDISITREKASVVDSEIAKQTKTYDIEYGLHLSIKNMFWPAKLIISVADFRVIANEDGKERTGFVCPAFVQARVDDIWIREIKLERIGTYRFKFRSRPEAAEALEKIRSICKLN